MVGRGAGLMVIGGRGYHAPPGVGVLIDRSRVRVTYPSLSKADVLRRLRRASASLERKLPISRIILFGSYATGAHTVGSDIDVLVVYKGRERRKAYKIVMDEMRLPRIEPRIYTDAQFEDLTAKSPKFAQALDKDGILITGAKGEKWSRGAKTG